MIHTLTFKNTPAEIEAFCVSEQEKVKLDLQAVAEIPLEQANFKNVVLETERVSTEFSNRILAKLFLKHVSTDEQIRAAADRCETAVQQLFVDLFGRQDLYARFKAVKDKKPILNEPDQQLLDDYVLNFKRNGLELSSEKLAQYLDKKKKLVALESEFGKNIADWEDHLEVNEADLTGLSADYISTLPKLPNGKRKVNLDYPHYHAFMENAESGEVRKQLEYKFNSRGGPKNTKLLEEAIKIRATLAKLLGYENHAAYVLEKRMAKTSANVEAFLAKLAAKLKPGGQSNLNELLTLKKIHLNNSTETEINSWDYRFYTNQLRKQKYQVDNEAIKKYFPLPTVLKGMFEIYEKLLGVSFVANEKADRWHSSVTLYEVKKANLTQAYFYMDLFPREAKYGHAAAFTLVSGYQLPDGLYQLPYSAIVANFSAPTAGNPSLLEHSEVETLFHEFGHIMHQILTRATYATFSGTNVKTDFVEAPSQMLENWVWKKETLAKLSGHYQTGNPLPDDLIDKLVKAKLLGVGLQYLRQIAFATIDMAYHTSENVNSTEVYARLMKEVMAIPIQAGTQPQASFGHLMGGYDAGYYGYLWSKVYAQDLFRRFEQEGLLNAKTGEDYRHWILEPGGQKEPRQLLEGFLGREPNEEAFLKSLGLVA